MAAKVGEMLKHDPFKLRFTQSNGANGTPKNIVRRHGNLTVAELIQPSYMSANNNLLYYEILDVSIIELETKKSLKITWVGATNKEEVRFVVSRVSVDGTDAALTAGIAPVPATQEHDDERSCAGLAAQGCHPLAGRIWSHQDLRNRRWSIAEAVQWERVGTGGRRWCRAVR
jgi:hypothetical protein